MGDTQGPKFHSSFWIAPKACCSAHQGWSHTLCPRLSDFVHTSPPPPCSMTYQAPSQAWRTALKVDTVTTARMETASQPRGGTDTWLEPAWQPSYCMYMNTYIYIYKHILAWGTSRHSTNISIDCRMRGTGLKHAWKMFGTRWEEDWKLEHAWNKLGTDVGWAWKDVSDACRWRSKAINRGRPADHGRQSGTCQACYKLNSFQPVPSMFQARSNPFHAAVPSKSSLQATRSKSVRIQACSNAPGPVPIASQPVPSPSQHLPSSSQPVQSPSQHVPPVTTRSKLAPSRSKPVTTRSAPVTVPSNRRVM